MILIIIPIQTLVKRDQKVQIISGRGENRIWIQDIVTNVFLSKTNTLPK